MIKKTNQQECNSPIKPQTDKKKFKKKYRQTNQSTAKMLQTNHTTQKQTTPLVELQIRQ